MNLKNIKTIMIFTLLLASTSIASAQEGDRNPGAHEGLRLGFDVEVDPVAYVANGHSLHVGIWLDRIRLDIGAFGLDVPEFAHGQEGFEQAFSGFGTKADLYFNDDRDGWFVGVEGGVSKVIISRTEGDLAKQYTQGSAGGRGGYRWRFADNFYAVPWVGVGYAFGPEKVTLGGEEFTNNPLLIFPTFHVGYQIN